MGILTRVPKSLMYPSKPGSISFCVPTFCHSLGAWTMEANYQSTDKQKFKAPFDVKESSEESVCRGHVEAWAGTKGKP